MPILTSLYSVPDAIEEERYYFHKSRTFIYPLLGIDRSASISPVKTYLSWDNITHQDMKLICLYYNRVDGVFKKFAQSVLHKSRFFHSIEEVESSGEGIPQVLYIFDMRPYQADWQMFLEGRYSLLSPGMKTKIKNHFKGNSVNHAYVDSFLNPNKYYKNYAHLLGTTESVLREVVELASPPDLERERLHIRSKMDFNL